MADDKKVDYEVSADPSEFEKGMKKGAAAATEFSGNVDKEFKKVQATFTSVQKVFLGMAAVFAGGGAFKAILGATAEWNGEAGKMAKQLGITTQAASVLNVALNHLGIDSELYTSASQKLSKQIFSNAAAFETLGVSVRDTATGAYRPVTEVMADVNKKLAEIKNPIEQNIAGNQVYGKSWGEIRTIIRLTSDQMEAAEKRARDLGLIVGPEGVASAKQYKEQMRDVALVGKALEIQFGNALLPIFTKTGAFMAEEGPAAAKTFALILESVAFGAQATWLALKDMGDGIGAMAAQAAALLSGDLDGFTAIGKARDDEAAKNEATYERMKARFGQPLPAAKVEKSTDQGPQYHFKPEKEPKEKKQTSGWDAELAEMKVAFQEKMNIEGSFAVFSKQTELKFWQDRLALTTAGSSDNVSVRRKMAELQLAMGQEAYQHEMAQLQTREAAYRNNMTAKLAILDQEAALVKQRFGTESKEYEDIQKKIVEAKRTAAEQIKQIDLLRAQGARDAGLAELQAQRQSAQLELEMGLITQQELLEKQRAFEDQKNAIAMKALQERLQLAMQDPDKNTVELERIHQEIEQLERQHQQRLTDIRVGSLKQSQQASMTAVNSVGAGFQNILKQTMQGTMTFKQAVNAAWTAVTDAVSNAVAKMAADWLMIQLKNLIFGKVVAESTILTKSAEAGAGGIASMAAAPWPLNMTAPAFGAAMSAAAMAFAPMASASGGFDIPGSLNPITQLHAREMVLPAKHADVIRSMADGEGGGGGTAGDVHLHVNALDAHSVARMFKDNGQHIVAALKKQQRNLAT